jgi:PhzF family phenazine biosynthesis protein
VKLKLYQIDAFTDTVFGGNPAAVCPLDQWPEDELLQKISMENNLAETAFYVKDGDQYTIRWFTPTIEVNLCGHATLATAYVLFYHENHIGDRINFHSPRSGILPVTRDGDLLTLNFPADTLQKIDVTHDLSAAFTSTPKLAFKGKTDYLLVFESEEVVKGLAPDYVAVSKLPVRGVIATAKGDKVDFVSRFFAPQSGINEDPVTGSAHTSLTPYWSKVLAKTELNARQLSPRTGALKCRVKGDRVEISGTCQPYLVGEIFLP